MEGLVYTCPVCGQPTQQVKETNYLQSGFDVLVCETPTCLAKTWLATPDDLS